MSERGERIQKLLALEIARVVEDLELRRGFLIQVWGKHRARAPFLETTFTRWATLSFGDLAELHPITVDAVSAFYRELDAFRLYLGFTQAMPQELTQRYDGAVTRLQTLRDEALLVLGDPDPGQPVEIQLDWATWEE